MSKPNIKINIQTQDQMQTSSPSLTHPLHTPPESSSAAQQEESSLRNFCQPAISKVVEFEQFILQEDKDPSINHSAEKGFFISPSFKKGEKSHRDYKLVIPSDNEEERKAQQISSCYDEPPVPSNKKKIGREGHFVFPFPQISHNKQLEKESQPDQQRMFQKERREFYKEKSKLEKELLVKEGQIQILEKLLSSLLGGKGEYRNLSDHLASLEYYQGLIAEKDRQISGLLSKITEINHDLKVRGEQLSQLRDKCTRLAFQNQNLANQIYVAETIKASASYYKTNQPYDENRDMTELHWHREDGLHFLERRLQTLSQHRKELEDRSKKKCNNLSFNFDEPSKKGVYLIDGRVLSLNSSK